MSNILKKIIAGIVVVAVIIIALSIYSQRKQVPDLIKIGILAPLSGEYAVAGENMEKGMRLALSLYQEKHPNQTISFVVEDDGWDVKKGISAYKKLVSIDHIDALMMLSTPVIDAIHEDIKKTTMPVMQIGIQTIGIAPDNIFQMSPSPEMPIESFAKYINSNFDLKKVAVLYDNTAGGILFYKAFKNSYKGNTSAMVVNKKDDLKGYANKISNDGYDGVVFLNSPENGAIAVKDIVSLNKSHPQFLFDAQLQTGFADYERILGDTNVLNGSISLWLKQGETKHFVDEFKKKYANEPGFIADFGYDTFNTLMNAYNTEDRIWLSNIQDTDAIGASGGVKFDQNGIRLQDIVINKVEGGKITPAQ